VLAEAGAGDTVRELLRRIAARNSRVTTLASRNRRTVTIASTRICVLLARTAVVALLGFASPLAAELTVTTSPAFFNPSIGRTAQIRVASPLPGEIGVEILDRDRLPIRTIGPVKLEAIVDVSWDGKDDSGVVVPNEAYSVRIRFSGPGGKQELYDPASDLTGAPVSIDDFSYSRVDGVLNYRLQAPSRVHIQAGQRAAKESKDSEGPILQTVVDRAPRTGGAISEKWSGYDESQKVYVPDLPDFVMAILAAPLPKNSLITTGSRGETFAAYAARRRPAPTSTREQVFGPAMQHHEGLSALQDQSPRLTTKLVSGEETETWTIQRGRPTRATFGLEPALEPVFLTPRARLHLFCDATLVATVECAKNPCPVDLPPAALPAGQHRIVANWDSGLGPVGVALKLVEIQ
jgi:hypothetical protein